ncbi:hypothetical protein [Paraburkholderia tropica]|uniref:hypothetical protein n=1 Tax=Paraburkholderia tropica TaxID=92647 RepID=UPI003D28844B
MSASRPLFRDADKQLPDRSFIRPLIVALAALVILHIRMPERFTKGFLWAEDAPIFIGEAYANGFKSFATPYAGYLHFIPRTFAYLYSLSAPIKDFPYLFVWTTAILSALICAGLYRIASRDMHWAFAALFALTPVLVPSSGEVWLNLTNIQWIAAPFLLALLWDCVAHPGPDIGRPALIAVLSLTGSFSVTFAPVSVFALYLLRAEPRRFSSPFFVSLACVCAQLLMMRIGAPNHPRQHPAAEYLHLPWGEAFFRYFVIDSTLREKIANQLGGSLYLIAIAVFGFFAASPFFMRGRWRAIIALVLGIALGLWIVGVVRADDTSQFVRWAGFGGRFTFVPLILICWTLLCIMSKSSIRTARALAVVLFALIIARGFHNDSAPWMPYSITTQSDGTVNVLAAPGGGFQTTVHP